MLQPTDDPFGDEKRAKEVADGDWAAKAVRDSIAAAPDGKTFATGGADGQILIWPMP